MQTHIVEERAIKRDRQTERDRDRQADKRKIGVEKRRKERVHFTDKETERKIRAGQKKRDKEREKKLRIG